MSEEYTPDIVSVIDEDGKEHIFEELDRIETTNGKFIALLPLNDDSQGSEEDNGELIILSVDEINGETYLEPIEDEEVFMEVGKIFEERLSEMFEFDTEE